MQENNQFNEITVDWHQPGIVIDTTQVPAFTAAADDIERFRQDGVGLLRGVFADWFPVLWHRSE